MDEEAALLDRARRRLYSAALADALDEHGVHRSALPSTIRPLDEGLVLCGFARTGLYARIYHDAPALDVYEHEIALVDDLRPGEVVVLACDGNRMIAPWGELLTTRARVLGAAGLVTDGAVRDVRAIRAAGFPVHCGGANPVDTRHRGKMMLTDVPVEIGGVPIAPGDLVFGDVDGVVVAPRALIEDVLPAALRKAEAENGMRDDLRAGMSLREAFCKHGIL